MYKTDIKTNYENDYSIHRQSTLKNHQAWKIKASFILEKH